jgi:integrase
MGRHRSGGARLWKRDGIWYATVYDHAGRRLKVSTRCTDRKAAEAVAREIERRAADPRSAAKNEATVGTALVSLLQDVQRRVTLGERSPATATFYTKKAGHLVRLLRPATRLADVTRAEVDAYVASRTAEGAKAHTIVKELVTLRQALSLAAERDQWDGDVRRVIPKLASGYKPKADDQRVLTVEELGKLLADLPPDRAARVAWSVAVMARGSEPDRARATDIDFERGLVRVRGTKTTAADRYVPILMPWQFSLLRYALEHHEPTKAGVMFQPWGNVRRDLHAAAARIHTDAVPFAALNPTDLRHTGARWQLLCGVARDHVWPAMGHTSGRMLDLTYGQLAAEDLRRAAISALDAAGRKLWDKCGTESGPPMRQVGPVRQEGASQGVENEGERVPRGGIEPPTRGFSGHEAVWPKPRGWKGIPQLRIVGGTNAGQ